MNLSDYLKSVFRTAVPAFFGALLMSLMAKYLGYDLDPGIALAIGAAATIASVAAVGRALERSSIPLLAFVGRFLLTLGPDLGQPIYVKPEIEPTSGTTMRRLQ